jgi:hypothetical protein
MPLRQANADTISSPYGSHFYFRFYKPIALSLPQSRRHGREKEPSCRERESINTQRR